jgi:transposase-like protein
MGAITTEVVETGEKRDRRGRRMTPAERREAIVREYRASGLTQAAFARREGLNYSTFAGWVLKSAKTPSSRPIQFAQLRLPASLPRSLATSAALEVRLTDGTSVRGNNAAELAQLVRALRA